VVTVDDVTLFHALSERYRLVVESTTDAILITSGDGIIEFANDAAMALFAQPAGLAGLRLDALLPADMTEEFTGHMSRALTGEAMRFNGEVLRAGNERRTVSMSLAPFRGGSQVPGLVVSLRDMTDETRARSEVAAANSRYRNLVEVAADAIYTLDPSGIFTSVNVACETLAGIPRDAMIGRSILPMLEPSETAAAISHFKAALGGATRRYESHLVRPDGTRRLLSLSNTPIRRGNDVVGVLGVARDVTDERARAAALERAEALYTRLVEGADDAICTVDEEGNFTSVNRALEKTMGVTREAVIGHHFTTLLPADERDDKWTMFASTITGKRHRREIRFIDALGQRRVASVNSAPIVDHGRIAGAVAIIRDVTEERGLMEQVVRREKLVALGELVGGVAHEVNSPLTGILAFGQILQGEALGSEQNQRAVDTIVNEAKRAARIVGKLLTFARQNPAEKMRTELNQVLLDTIELRRYPLKMQQITLDLELEDGLPVTWADPFQLQQVFINLLSNAEQALASLPGERRIAVRTSARDGQLVTVISDTGPGIAPEHLAHIFNPFYTTKPRGIGTGLGLSISFGIVREHGGMLRALAEQGRGAAFEVSLPIIDSPSSGAY
jgi:PAS domain S-box-containing protein